MKSQNFVLVKYEAEDGMVFDWKDLSAHIVEEPQEDGTVIEIQEHLYAKVLFIGQFDSIDNYVEVPAPVEE